MFFAVAVAWLAKPDSQCHVKYDHSKSMKVTTVMQAKSSSIPSPLPSPREQSNTNQKKVCEFAWTDPGDGSKDY